MKSCRELEAGVKCALSIVAILGLLAGCATVRGSEGSASPASYAGTWVGTVTGSEMASASGQVATPVRMTIGDDGRWALTGPGGTREEGVTRPIPNGVRLEGKVTGGDPAGVGREVLYDLKSRGPNALYGRGDAFYLGHRVDTGVSLRRV